MQEKISENDVLLVKEPNDEQLKVVSGVDGDGNMKTVSPKMENSAEFMKIDKQANMLENFFTNFMRQAKNPSEFGFFKVPNEKVEVTSEYLANEIKREDDPVSKKFVDNARFDVDEFLKEREQSKEQSTGYKPYDKERIDWDQFEKLGVKRESLEKSGALEPMLNYRKSPQLVDINAQLGDTTIRTQGRLSLKETEDGRIVPVIHAIRKEPQLDRPFFEHTFTKEDKANLQKNGNLGRKIDLVNVKTGEVIPSYVSIDKQTNELVAYRADRVKIPNEIKGVKLDAEQKKSLAEGKEVYIEGMTAKSGNKFNANVQYNADKRGIEFRFDETQRQQQRASNSGEMRIPNKLGGMELSEESRTKLKEGEAIYVKGLKDKNGKEYNAYVKVNKDENKLDFYKWNPDKSKSQSKDQKENKEVKESVASEQTEQKQQKQKSRGFKM